MRYVRERGFRGLITIFSNGVQAERLIALLDADPRSEAVLNYSIYHGRDAEPLPRAREGAARGLGRRQSRAGSSRATRCSSTPAAGPTRRSTATARPTSTASAPAACAASPCSPREGRFHACPFAAEIDSPHYDLGGVGTAPGGGVPELPHVPALGRRGARPDGARRAAFRAARCATGTWPSCRCPPTSAEGPPPAGRSSAEDDEYPLNDQRELLGRELAHPLGQHRPIDRHDLGRVGNGVLGEPGRAGGNITFPGASAQARLLVSGTHTTVAIRPRLSDPLHDDNGASKARRRPGRAPTARPPHLAWRGLPSLRSKDPTGCGSGRGIPPRLGRRSTTLFMAACDLFRRVSGGRYSASASAYSSTARFPARRAWPPLAGVKDVVGNGVPRLHTQVQPSDVGRASRSDRCHGPVRAGISRRIMTEATPGDDGDPAPSGRGRATRPRPGRSVGGSGRRYAWLRRAASVALVVALRDRRRDGVGLLLGAAHLALAFEHGAFLDHQARALEVARDAAAARRAARASRRAVTSPVTTVDDDARRTCAFTTAPSPTTSVPWAAISPST